MYREQIRNQYDRFSPGYRRIADYLLDNYQDAAFMTAGEIARVVHVDTALVVRFAQRLGYPGFPELLNAIQADVKKDLQAAYVPADGEDTPVGVYRRNLLQDRNNLDVMLQHIDVELLETVVRLLASAQRILVIGEGNLSFLAEAFAMRLVVLGYRAHTMSNEFTGQASMLTSLDTNDIIIGLSLTAMSPNIAAVIKTAADLGVTTVVIVSAVSNLAASNARYVLHAPATAVGILPSWTATAAVLQGLTQALVFTREDFSAAWALRTDRLLKSHLATFREKLTGVRDTVAEYNLNVDQS